MKISSLLKKFYLPEVRLYNYSFYIVIALKLRFFNQDAFLIFGYLVLHYVFKFYEIHVMILN